MVVMTANVMNVFNTTELSLKMVKMIKENMCAEIRMLQNTNSGLKNQRSKTWKAIVCSWIGKLSIVKM